MDFDVDLPDLTCPDLFLISVERVTYVVLDKPWKKLLIKLTLYGEILIDRSGIHLEKDMSVPFGHTVARTVCLFDILCAPKSV